MKQQPASRMAQHENFFREVSEDLRNERFKQLWERFGLYLIALVIVVILGTAGYVAYGYWNGQKAAQSGDQFLAALKLADANKPDQALKALDALEKSGHGDYPALARMRAASIHAEQGDVKAAVAAFAAIGQDENIPLAIRYAARIRAGYLLVDHGTYDQVADQVQPLSGADNQFRNSAREVLGLAAWKAGDMKNARKWFELITGDTSAPAAISAQAQMMLDLIKAGDKPEKPS